MTTLDPAALRKRFHAADVEREALMERMKPTWEARNALVKQIQELEAQADALSKEMRPTRDRLFELENERAQIARFFA
jgi:chromosome segregation ATPase